MLSPGDYVIAVRGPGKGLEGVVKSVNPDSGTFKMRVRGEYADKVAEMDMAVGEVKKAFQVKSTLLCDLLVSRSMCCVPFLTSQAGNHVEVLRGVNAGSTGSVIATCALDERNLEGVWVAYLLLDGEMKEIQVPVDDIQVRLSVCVKFLVMFVARLCACVSVFPRVVWWVYVPVCVRVGSSRHACLVSCSLGWQLSTRMATSGNKLEGYELYDLVDVSRPLPASLFSCSYTRGYLSILSCGTDR